MKLPKTFRSLWSRMLTRLGLRPKPTPQNRLAEQLGHPARRTPQQWGSWRKETVARVKLLLANRKGVVAARELSRALLQDPENPVFHSLMEEAVSLKLQREAKAGQPDPWAGLPSELRDQALQLEGFQLYLEEVEQMIDKAGFTPLPAPPRTSR